MMEWKEYSLTEFVEFNPKVEVQPDQEYSFVEMPDLEPGRKVVYPSGTRKPNGLTKFQNGDTLFAKITPCLENGKISQVQGLEGNIGVGSTEFFVFRGRENLSDNDFVHYLLKWYSVKKYAEKNMSGSAGHQRVPADCLHNLRLPLPPYEENTKIGALLSCLDNKIENLQRQNQTLEKMAQTLFTQWFVDFNFPDENGNPYKDSGGEMVASELGEIPKGWSSSKLSDFGKIICGKTPSKKEKKYYGKDIPFVKIPDMHNKIFIIETNEYLSFEGSKSQKSKLLPIDSILVSCIATVGLVGINSIPSHTNQQINAIEIKDTFTREYLFFQLKRLKPYLLALGSGGSATLNINTSTFGNIVILSAKKRKIKEFHRRIKIVFDKIQSNLKSIKTLTQTRDTLLPKLMSGQIRIKD